MDRQENKYVYYSIKDDRTRQIIALAENMMGGCLDCFHRRTLDLVAFQQIRLRCIQIASNMFDKPTVLSPEGAGMRLEGMVVGAEATGVIGSELPQGKRLSMDSPTRLYM